MYGFLCRPLCGGAIALQQATGCKEAEYFGLEKLLAFSWFVSHCTHAVNYYVLTQTTAQANSKLVLDTKSVDDGRAAVISYGVGENARSHRGRRHPIWHFPVSFVFLLPCLSILTGTLSVMP